MHEQKFVDKTLQSLKTMPSRDSYRQVATTLQGSVVNALSSMSRARQPATRWRQRRRQRTLDPFAVVIVVLILILYCIVLYCVVVLFKNDVAYRERER